MGNKSTVLQVRDVDNEDDDVDAAPAAPPRAMGDATIRVHMLMDVSDGVQMQIRYDSRTDDHSSLQTRIRDVARFVHSSRCVSIYVEMGPRVQLSPLTRQFISECVSASVAMAAAHPAPIRARDPGAVCAITMYTIALRQLGAPTPQQRIVADFILSVCLPQLGCRFAASSQGVLTTTNAAGQQHSRLEQMGPYSGDRWLKG